MKKGSSTALGAGLFALLLVIVITLFRADDIVALKDEYIRSYISKAWKQDKASDVVFKHRGIQLICTSSNVCGLYDDDRVGMLEGSIKGFWHDPNKDVTLIEYDSVQMNEDGEMVYGGIGFALIDHNLSNKVVSVTFSKEGLFIYDGAKFERAKIRPIN